MKQLTDLLVNGGEEPAALLAERVVLSQMISTASQRLNRRDLELSGISMNGTGNYAAR